MRALPLADNTNKRLGWHGGRAPLLAKIGSARMKSDKMIAISLLGLAGAGSAAGLLAWVLPKGGIRNLLLIGAGAFVVAIVLRLVSRRPLAQLVHCDVAAKPGATSMPPQDASAKPMQRRLLIPLVSALVLLCGGFGVALQSIQQYHLDESSRQLLEVAVFDMQQRLSEEARSLAAFEGLLLHQSDLVDALKCQDRDRLLAVSNSLFAQLHETHNITHFYFHGPDRVNLLRVHQPERYGDRIDRYTALQAERTGKTASGLELGPLGTFTLRVVRPVFDEGVLLGYLELGQEIEDLLESLCREHTIELAVIIHKSDLNRADWEAGMKMLERDADWDRFADEVLIHSSMNQFPVECDSCLHGESAHQDTTSAQEASFDGKPWRFMIKPLLDVSGTEVGDLYLFHNVAMATARFNRLFLLSSGAGLIVLILLTWSLYVALRRVDQNIFDWQAELSNSERFQRTLTEMSPDSIYVLGRDLTIHMANRLPPGCREEEVIGRSALSLVRPDYQQCLREAFDQSLESRSLKSAETGVRLPDGEHVLLNRLSPLPGADEEHAVLLIATDITNRKEVERELRDNSAMLGEALENEKRATYELELAMSRLELAATTDKLTGLPNRTVLLDRLEQAMRRSSRDGSRFAVLFFDFDRFKIVNDSLGHDVGDALLCDIADIFRGELRQSDTVARFGGDEFVVLLDGLSEWSDAHLTAKRLLDRFAQPHDLAGHQIVSTASIGLVTNEHDHQHAADLIRDADAAMYRAKEGGKSRVMTFDRAMHAQALRLLSLEADLRRAIEREQLRVVYQPIVELATGRILGFEALLRWDHPEQGEISPVDFIPIAEETGLIISVGRWVLREACRQISDWNRGLRLESRLSMNVNISKRQLMDSSVVEDVLEYLREFDVPATDLKLEITESVIADDQSEVISRLIQLRENGLQIALDDFGTGVSSLSTLHQYPIDVLKIDQSFVRSLDGDRSLLAVVASITALAGNLGITSVAEGIETLDVIGALQSIGCELGQGYYFAKPMASADAEAYLRDNLRNKQAA